MTACIYTDGRLCIAEGIPCNGADLDAECFTAEAKVEVDEAGGYLSPSGFPLAEPDLSLARAIAESDGS